MSGWFASAAISTTVYGPCATLSLVDELSLDFSTEVDELPMDVDDALKADDVLSASAGAAEKTIASALTKGTTALNTCCMKT